LPTNIGSAADLQKVGRKVVLIGKVEVGVFFIDGEFIGWHNYCPHMGGPVCQGAIYKRVIEPLNEDRSSYSYDQHPTDVNIVCPWHGVEFDLRTGQVPANPKMRLRPVRLEVIDGDVWVNV
jgi:nitrite reductase/ring-hydroxylating ferredoxin subunit